jgi:O-antigen ligase
LFIALFFTFSRGGYFAMLATLIFFGLVFLFKTSFFKFSKKRKILLFAVYCLLFTVLLVPITPISKCFYSSFDSLRSSNIERIEVWNEAFDVINKHLWLGVGIGNFPKFVDPWAKYLSPINAHSVYLDIASEMGIFSLWVWLFLFFGTIFSLLKTDMNFASFGLAGSLVWFSCHALVETSIYNPTILALLMVLLGLSTIIIQKSKL